MKYREQQEGSVLLAIIIMLPFIILIVALYTSLAVSSFKTAKRDQSHTYAQLATDAGIDAAMEQINQDTNWVGTGGEVEIQNSNGFRTTYEITVSDVDTTHKNLVSIGRTYRPTTATAPEATIKVTVALRGVQSGSYSVVSGVGGLVLENTAKVVNGNVFVNGTLSLSNTASIGLIILPVDVQVAHQSCPFPADATYPRQCAHGERGEPISINHLAHIYGDVKATNQSDGAKMTNGGLVSQCYDATHNTGCVSPIDLPDYDRAAQQAAVAHTQSGSSAGCSLGVKTWQANSKFTGDVSVSNFCVITVEGDIWITGNFELKNTAILKVKEGLTTPPVIMIDGSDGFTMRNASVMLANLSLVGFRVITYWSSGSCSPECSDVTGTDLYNSQTHTTINLDNLATAAQTEFYARWSELDVGNSGSVGALAGQTVKLKNSAAVTLGTSVTGFGETVWVIASYRRT